MPDFNKMKTRLGALRYNHAAIFGFVIAVLTMLLLRNFFFSDGLYLFKDVACDSVNVFYPRWLHVARYLRTEGLPTWSFATGMGQNIFPGGLNNPFSLVLYLVGPYRMAGAIAYVEALKIVLAGMLGYGYLRLLKLDGYAAMIGALCLAFSGYLVTGTTGWYGHSALFVYGLFLLYATEQLYQKKNLLLFPLAIVLLSSSSLFSIYIFTVFLFLYVLLRYFSDHGWQPKGLVILLLQMAGLGTLGLLMSAVFTCSPLLKMLFSPRVAGESGHFNQLAAQPVFALLDKQEFVTVFLRLFGTDILGTGEVFFREVNGAPAPVHAFRGVGNHFESPLFYCGIPCLLLAAQYLALAKGRERRLAAAFAGIWLFIILFPYARYALYLFTGDYYKNGMNFFVPVTLVLFSARALDLLRKGTRLNVPALAVSLIVCLVLLNFPYFPREAGQVDMVIRILANLLLLGYGILLYLTQRPAHKELAWALIPVCLCIELVYLSDITVNNRQVVTRAEVEARQGYNDYTVEALAAIRQHDSGFYRIDKTYHSGGSVYETLNDGLAQGYFPTESYNSFNQINYIRFLDAVGVIDGRDEGQTRWCPGLENHPYLQALAGVKYGLSKKRHPYFEKFGYQYAGTFGDVHAFVNLLALPLGVAYDNVIPAGVFSNLTGMQKEFMLLKGFVPESNSDAEKFFAPAVIPSTDVYSFEDFLADIAARRQAVFTIDSFAQKSITGHIDLEDTRMLVLSIPFDTGWSVQVNGQPRQLERVNYGLTGLFLEDGKHQVALSYQPPFLRTSAVLSLIGWIGFAALIGFVVLMRPERCG